MTDLSSSLMAMLQPESPSLQYFGDEPVKGSEASDLRVGQRLSDEAREVAIVRAGQALIAAYSRKEAARRRYAESICLTDKADEDLAATDARRALEAMQALIRGRSSEYVAKLERERGLA